MCDVTQWSGWNIFSHLKNFFIQTMSLVPGVKDNNPAIDNSIQSSLKSYGLQWIPHSDITSSLVDKVIYFYKHKHSNSDFDKLLIGSSEECTPTLVSEFARIYSLPTHKYKNDVSQYQMA